MKISAQLQALCMMAMCFWSFIGLFEGIRCALRNDRRSDGAATSLFVFHAALVFIFNGLALLLCIIFLWLDNFAPPQGLARFCLDLGEFLLFTLGLTLVPYPAFRQVGFFSFRRLHGTPDARR